MDTILLFLGLLLSFVMAINIGGNDAANPTSTAVGSGALSLRRALILFAIFVILGALLQGYMVIKTIGKGIVPEIDILGAFIIVLSANIWIFFATMRGMAISTTHSIVAAVIGYGIARYFSEINLGVLTTIFISWITSPLLSALLSFFLYKLSYFLIKKYSLKSEKILRILVIFTLLFSAYSFGANDVANATGVYITIACKLGQMPDFNAMILLSIYGAIGIIIGGYILGPKVIRTLAFRITRLDLLMALAAGLANATTVYLFTTLPYFIFGYGLPISTSYVAVGSILGVGGAKSSINMKITAKLISYWIMTIPFNIILTFALYKLFTIFSIF